MTQLVPLPGLTYYSWALVSQLGLVTCLGWWLVLVCSLWMSISSLMNSSYSLSLDSVQSTCLSQQLVSDSPVWRDNPLNEVMLMKTHYFHFDWGPTISVPEEALSVHVLPKVHLTPLVHICPCIYATEHIMVILHVFTSLQHHAVLLYSMSCITYVTTRFTYMNLDGHAVG